MKNLKAIIVAGFALFAMFFGAGNLIFAPYLGITTGTQWVSSLIGFGITDVGFVTLALVAAMRAGGSLKDMGKKVSPKFGWVFATAIILAIGPGFATPRTGATAYEMVKVSFMPNLNAWIACGIFFAAAYYFCRSENSALDKVGGILTPGLLITVALIIVKAIITPIGPIVEVETQNVFTAGFLEGYQTMDSFGAMAFVALVIANLRNAGIREEDMKKSFGKVILIACISLMLIYFGLGHMGATMSGLDLGNIERVQLLIKGTHMLLGNFGVGLLCIAMCLACLTTAVGCTASVGNFFNELTRGKLSYKRAVLISCILSYFISVKGVEAILALALPVLIALYPVSVALCICNVLPERWNNHATQLGAVIGAAFPGIFAFLSSTVMRENIWDNFSLMFPDWFQLFTWLIPSLIIAVLLNFILPNKEPMILSEEEA